VIFQQCCRLLSPSVPVFSQIIYDRLLVSYALLRRFKTRL
jgi:hypothetical protein